MKFNSIPIEIEDNIIKMIEQARNPDTAAELLLGFLKNNHPNNDLAFQAIEPSKGRWKWWNERFWQPVCDVAFCRDIATAFGGSADRTKKIISRLQLLTGIHIDRWDRRHQTVFLDRVLEIDHGVVRPRKFLKDDLGTISMDCRIKNTPTPKWQAYLDQMLPDKDDQDCLGEMFGAVHFPYVNLSVIFILQGPSGTGKSTTMRMLRKFVGDSRVHGASLASLKDKHTTAGLVGKWLNISGECRQISQDAETKLLALTGGDTVLIDEKFLPTYSTHLPVRMALMTNETPRFWDSGNALWSRLVMLPFLHVIADNEQILPDVLLGTFDDERNGIAAWALKGLLHSPEKRDEGQQLHAIRDRQETTGTTPPRK